ncbi:MAG: ATP-binding protein [Clostridia bacterium]|nr:ATP-binding protein [Clostridia bacterium]
MKTKKGTIIKNHLLYAGLTQTEYEAIQPLYLAPNAVILRAVSVLSGVLFFLYGVFEVFVSPRVFVKFLFLGHGLVDLGIAVLAWGKWRGDRKKEGLLAELFVLSFYLLGIFMGTVLVPNQLAVLFPVAVVAMPAVFNDRPLISYAEMGAAVLLFSVLALAYKESIYALTDIADVTVFALASCVLNGFLYHSKAKGCLSEYRANESNAVLKEQIAVIGGLSNAYFACIETDVANKTYRIFKDTDFVRSLVEDGSCPTIDKAFDKYLPYVTATEFLEKLREFTDCATLAERTENADVISAEYRGRKPEWAWCRASWIVTARDEAGHARQCLYVVEDVTENIRERAQHDRELHTALEAADAANRAKTEFLFSMSHDIRTPMNAILGYSSLMKKELTDPKLLDYQEKIEQSGNLLLSIINNVLDMSRIDSGKATLHEEYIRVSAIPGGIAQILGAEAGKKDIRLSYEFDIVHDHILADITKLSEIYVNITSNAIKYTPAGGSVSARIEELPCEEEGCAYFRTTITDTGIGMSKEFLPHLFDSFSREQNTTMSKVAGTGLGLAIVKKLVDLMDGTIAVESEPGKGSSFAVTLKHRLASEEDIAAAEAKQGVRAEELRTEGRRILLAEDNDLNAEIAVTVLESVGFAVDRAEDGRVCTDMMASAEAGHYDLVLMDIQMPNMDGYAATRAIRSMEDKGKADIPIVAMTANAFEEDRNNAFAAGMNGHIAKPIDMNALMTVLSGLLNGGDATK